MHTDSLGLNTMVIYVSGLRLDTSYTFSNGFTISKFGDLPNDAISKGTLRVLRKNHSELYDDLYVLYKTVESKNYTHELFEQAVFTSEIISLNLSGHNGVEVLAASDYCTWNVPNLRNYGISQKLSTIELDEIDENIRQFHERSPIEKECIKVALMYLNKSKVCIKNVNGNYEHAIFLRVALENCFNAPKHKKNSVIAERAAVLLDQFDSKLVKQRFKRIYDQTSTAVHTGKVPKVRKNNSKERKVTIEQYNMYDILVMSILKIIRNGFPNWEP
ncbi:hypothetical protein [Pseudoalteromonas sp.]|uniref:hypothetical protein n=1 Tax=Pseudoalteromonas sp. TaxID=53249 RepID=UPI0030014133